MIRASRQTGVLGLFVILLGVSLPAQQTQNNVPTELIAYPDLILYNAKIVTMDDPSVNNSPGRTVEAMAVRGDRIQFTGSTQQVLRYAGPQTRKMDLKGRTVVPGLMDTHNHIHQGAIAMWAQKNPAKIGSIARAFHVTGKTFEELTHGIELVIKEQMSHSLPGQWALIRLPSGPNRVGVGVPYMEAAKAGTGNAMTRKELDALAPKLPVMITATGGPFIVSTAGRDNLLEMYGVEPTDENEAAAISGRNVFERTLPHIYFAKHLDELADVLEEELRHTAAGGYTTFSSHIVGLTLMPAYQKLAREERMPMRFAFAHRFCNELEPDQAQCFLRLGDWAGMGNKYFWNTGVTLGSSDGGAPRFCSTMEPLPEYRKPGSPWLTERCGLKPGSPYYKAIYTALRTRYRYVAGHVFADKSMDTLMDIMERVMEENPDITLDFMRSLRVSSDHCGFYPRPEQLPRMKRLGIILSCNPSYVERNAPWLRVFGEDKGNWIVPIKNILDAGVMVAAETDGASQQVSFSVDNPVTPMTNLVLYLSRKSSRGELVGPAQAIDRVSALKMQTVWASFYVLREKELGTLEPGKFADFVVFNKDYFTVPQEEIPTVFPLMTVMGGKTRVLREELAKELGLPPVGPQKKWRFTKAADAPAPWWGKGR